MIGVCRVCGCTADQPCSLGPDPDDLVEGVDLLFEAPPQTCSWIRPDLCSACHDPDGDEVDDLVVDGDVDEPLLYDGHGVPVVWRGKGS